MQARPQSLAILILLLTAVVTPGAVRFVDLNSQTPTPPYTSWSTAATTIQDAVDAAVAGDEIVVTNGVYAAGGRTVSGGLTNRVVVEKPVQLRSVNGPAFTMIEGRKVPDTILGDNAVRCLYLGSGASLVGFTLTNGATRGPGTLDSSRTGGALWAVDQTAWVSNCTFVGNAARAYGTVYGATIYDSLILSNSVGADSCVLTNCVLTGNSSAGASRSYLYRCSVTNNHGYGVLDHSTAVSCLIAGNSSGGANASVLNNCLIISNSGYGGVHACVSVSNSTVVGNSSQYGAGGANNSGPLYNSIVYFNSNGNHADSPMTNCCTTPLPKAGAGNFEADPRLIDPAGGDFRLQPSSPCINGGNNAFSPGSTDLVGNPRIAGGTVDVGAYEFQAPGVFAVHYVDAQSPNPTPPYTSWATAARDIQDAVDAAIPGDEIVVTNGVYASGGRAVEGSMTNRVAIDKPLFVRSVNGPRHTIIQGRQVPITRNGPGAIRCVYLTVGASLSGFTLTGGGTLDTGGYYTENSGGGLWCVSATVAVSNCIIAGNSALYSAGGVYQGALYNCAIYNNSAGAFGGGALSSLMYQCTIIGNSGGGIDGPANLYNCIVYDNTPYNSSYQSGQPQLRRCITSPMCYPCFQTVDVDPRLASATHLSLDSPARGAGDPAFAAGADLDGEPFLNPPSIGCDEVILGMLNGPLSLEIQADFTNVTTGYPVRLIGLVDGKPGASSWDFGDGMSASNRAFIEHSWQVPGDYAVTFRAYNETHPQGVSTQMVIHVVPQPTYYVSVSNPAPAAPYTSWATAATNIQDALDAAIPGSRILVTNGVYATGTRSFTAPWPVRTRILLDKSLTLEAVNGPRWTIIDGTETNLGAYLRNGTSIHGFTITRSNGVRSESTNSTISNCVIVANSSGVEAGRLYDCTISNNASGLVNSVANRCVIVGNASSGASRSSLTNCLIAGNGVSASYGGGAYFCNVVNCTVVSNTATYAGGGVYGTNGITLNSIVYYNTAPNFPNVYQRALYCCSYPEFGEEGNITNAPAFVNPAAGDFRLQADSPCINAGNNAYVVPGSADLAGNPRILGPRVDMGAYETLPSLRAELSGIYTTLAWPAWASDFVLQETSDLVVNHWTDVAAEPVASGPEQTVTLPITGQLKFFRLHVP